MPTTSDPIPAVLPANSNPASVLVPIGPADEKRTQLNLAGQTNTASGESQRNENVRVNPIDTATARELTRRVGTTATLIPEFRADQNYFAAEYGRAPIAALSLPPDSSRGFHGTFWETHQNSATTARSFFQVGGVKPARDNDYGFRFTSRLVGAARLSVDANQQKSRGFVNGNVLVPRADERTPLTTDPRAYALIASWLAGYGGLPNLPFLDSRALNTNAPQSIDTNSASARIDLPLGKRDQFAIRYQLTSQFVDAFQLIAGQNPDSTIHNHSGMINWRRAISPTLLAVVSARFDRGTTAIVPDESAPAVRINLSNVIETSGLGTEIPVYRTQNQFREAASLQKTSGNHRVSFGGEAVRTQTNGQEQELRRGVISFQGQNGVDAVTNLRKGIANSYQQLLGETYRGYRTWNFIGYADDMWRVNRRLGLHFGLRYEPMPRPTEVNGIERMPFGCVCKPLAPRFAFSYLLPGNWGVLRSAYALEYGQMYSATFGQLRMNLPNAARVINNSPDLLNPLNGLSLSNLGPGFRSSLYDVASNLRLPYAHTYDFTWEFRIPGAQVQLGYVGSRAHGLIETLYNNRGGKVADPSKIIPATINDRRADQTLFDVYRIHNGAKAYFDAARVTVTIPAKHDFSGMISYWFSKAIDFGADYTSTNSGQLARDGRAPSEFLVHDRMKGLAAFDQTHALLFQGSYRTPRVPSHFLQSVVGRWNLSGVWLLKSGAPFTLQTGSDGPGFGNVDGQGSDRPDLRDPSVLGRTIGNPDTSSQMLPASAFGFLNPLQDSGNLGRNTFRRGKIANVNTALDRSFLLPREWTLQLRAEAVNLFNTPQFAEPNSILSSSTFGKITNTLNSGRTFRFRLQLQF